MLPSNSSGERLNSKVLVLIKPTDFVLAHLKSLFIRENIVDVPISQILVDNGTVVNILPASMMKKIDTINDDLVSTDINVSNFTRESTDT